MSNHARVFEVAAQLEGTTHDLKDVATPKEQADNAFLQELDEQVRCCSTCGWWCAVETFSGDSDECDDCADDV